MPTLAKSNNRQLETGLRSIPTSTPYGQPWWQGLGNSDMASSGQQEDGSVTPATLHPQGTVEGIPKDTETNARSGSLLCFTKHFTFFWLRLNVLYVYYSRKIIAIFKLQSLLVMLCLRFLQVVFIPRKNNIFSSSSHFIYSCEAE